jgi:hypothetical protein
MQDEIRRGSAIPGSHASRRGMVLGLVLLLGIVVLVVGMAMLTTSGGLLASSVDGKQRIRARYAAESMVALQIVAAMEKSSEFFGADLPGSTTPLSALATGNGEQAKAEIVNQVDGSGSATQELITTGRFKGLMGLKIPLLIQATGVAPGGAKSEIDAEIRLYQVPIFQFGVFYEGDLEINPGPPMQVGGPVHTNGNAYFRAGNGLKFQGPITVAGTLYQWTKLGNIGYFLAPDTSAIFEPSLNVSITAMDPGTQPPAVGGVRNVVDGAERISLPIGGAVPERLIAPRDSADPVALAKQQIDRKIPCPGGHCPLNRFVVGKDAKPSWIKGPSVFFDRREKRWVKVWDFDVSLIPSSFKDSIFYLADTTWTASDRGAKRGFVLNAFRIVNGGFLPRNMSIASANPVYILGDFNIPNPGGRCRPADYTGTVPDSLKYCNAMIASDAVTLLSSRWPEYDYAHRGMLGSLEQNPSNPYWTTFLGATLNSSTGKMDSSFAPEPTKGVPDDCATTGCGPLRVNAAILSGNKTTPAFALPPSNTSNQVFEDNYEGGWHNSIRFLENLSKDTVFFKGSFVCVWKASFRGLDTSSASRTFLANSVTGYFMPPTRVWSYDERFKNLNNMPPATPFLSTGVFSTWSERR